MATNGALTMTDPPQTVVLQPQPQPTNGAVPTETLLPLLPEQPATVTAPVYRNILVNVSGSQSQRVTFDACEGSNEHHYWDHHAGITQPHTTELFHLEFIGGGSISGIESDAGFEYELRRSRAPLISKPFIEPILSSVHNVGLLMTKITFEVKIACFKPGLTPFQDKWYLTVIEDSMGVRQHPRFIPASQNSSGSDMWHRVFTLTEDVNTSTWALSFLAANSTYYQLVPSTTRIETQQFTSTDPTEYCFAFGIDIV